jgi:hypothetical protein
MQSSNSSERKSAYTAASECQCGNGGEAMNLRKDPADRGAGSGCMARLVRVFILLCMADSNRGSHAPRIMAQEPNQCHRPSQNPQGVTHPNNMERTDHGASLIRLQEPARQSCIHSPRSRPSFSRSHLLESLKACHSLLAHLEGEAGRMCDPTNN